MLPAPPPRPRSAPHRPRPALGAAPRPTRRPRPAERSRRSSIRLLHMTRVTLLAADTCPTGGIDALRATCRLAGIDLQGLPQVVEAAPPRRPDPPPRHVERGGDVVVRQLGLDGHQPEQLLATERDPAEGHEDGAPVVGRDEGIDHGLAVVGTGDFWHLGRDDLAPLPAQDAEALVA